jgi:hypothetical protein
MGLGGSSMGLGLVPSGGGAGDRRGDKWGGAQPAMSRERWKWAGIAVVAHE